MARKSQAATASLPDVIKAWRKKHGITIADGARRLKIPYRTFQDWELGNHTPRGFTLRAIIAELKRR